MKHFFIEVYELELTIQRIILKEVYNDIKGESDRKKQEIDNKNKEIDSKRQEIAAKENQLKKAEEGGNGTVSGNGITAIPRRIGASV